MCSRSTNSAHERIPLRATRSALELTKAGHTTPQTEGDSGHDGDLVVELAHLDDLSLDLRFAREALEQSG
jgi:hypothetical protein